MFSLTSSIMVTRKWEIIVFVLNYLLFAAYIVYIEVFMFMNFDVLIYVYFRCYNCVEL